MKKWIMRCTIGLLCVLLLPYTVFAASSADAVEKVDVSAPCTLSLNYRSDEVPMQNFALSLYHVASVSEDYVISMTESFVPTKLTLNGISSSDEWDAVRMTLEGYVVAHDIAPLAVSSSDAEGKVIFGSLSPGLYFIPQMRFAIGSDFYRFQSVLVSVPDLGEDGKWNYDVSVIPKPTRAMSSGTDRKQYQVLKLWKDGGHLEKRTDSVEIDIFCDGEKVNTVELSEANNWTYEWTAPNDGAIWNVSEKNVPDGYVMTVEGHQTVFTVINTASDLSDLPPTGESGRVWLLILLLCGAGMLLVMLSLKPEKKRV